MRETCAAAANRPAQSLALLQILAVTWALLRFGGTQDHVFYQLYLLGVAAGMLLAVFSWSRQKVDLSTFTLLLIGASLAIATWRHPTLQAHGYALAALAWLSFATARYVAASGGRALTTVCRALIVLGGAEAIYGVLQVLGGGTQATGTLINRNHFAGLVTMTLCLTLGELSAMHLRHASDRRRSAHVAMRGALVLLCSIQGAAVLMSLSRGGTISLFATLTLLFVLLLYRGRHDRRVLPAATVVAVAVSVVGLGVAIGLGPLVERFGTIAGESRPQLFRDIAVMLGDHPLRGVGPGMFHSAFSRYQTVNLTRRYSHAHNDYLEVAADWGIPLAIVFWGFVLWTAYRAFRAFDRGRDRRRSGYELGFLAAIISILIHSFVDFNLQIPSNLMIFSTVLGMVWGMTDRTPLVAARRTASALVLSAFVALALGLSAVAVARRLVAEEVASRNTSVEGFETALRWDETNPVFHMTLGRWYRDEEDLRDLETARHHLERAAALHPGSSQLHWELSRLYTALGDDRQAEAALREAVRYSPGRPRYTWRLARFLIRKGASEQGLSVLESALERDRDLFEPALDLLVERRIDLESIAGAWPREPEERLYLLRSITRRVRADRLEVDPAPLGREWSALLGTTVLSPPEKGMFFIQYLLGRQSFETAREEWLALMAANDIVDRPFASGSNLIWNGRFELPQVRGPLSWRLRQDAALDAGIADSDSPDGGRGLTVRFHNPEQLDLPDVRQSFVIAEPGVYSLSFLSKSAGPTTGHGVHLSLWHSAEGIELARGEPVPGTAGWTRQTTTFEIERAPALVRLSLRRSRDPTIDSELNGGLALDDVIVSRLDDPADGPRSAG